MATTFELEADDAAQPVFTLGRVQLRPVRISDMDWLFDLETHPSLITRFRLAGRTPSPQEFHQVVWTNVLCQFIVIERATGRQAGLVLVFNADPFNGVASLALVADPEFHDTGIVTDGTVLLLDYVFRTWPFRKLYGESLDFNYRRFGDARSVRFDAAGFWRREGSYKDYYFFDGKYWDKHIVSISRTDWERLRGEALGQVEARASEAVTRRP